MYASVPGMHPCDALGELIDSRWRAANFDEDSFPGTAAAVLRECDPTLFPDPWEAVRWVNGSLTLPAQEDIEARFGNPPITLFRTDRFYISILFWLDGTTAIHQHAFSGAFKVLLGSSLHAQYAFDRRQKINNELLVGDLKLEHIELLRAGDTRQIVAGNHFIHALFHLERPSATLVIRTYHTKGSSPQYDYLKPWIARDPFHHEQALTRKLQTLSLLYGANHLDTRTLVKDLVEGSDFLTTFYVLQQAFRHDAETEAPIPNRTVSRPGFGEILDSARKRHGSLVDLLPPVFEEERRQADIIRRRAQVTAPDHRFLLALLLNLSDRGAVLELVRQQFPSQDAVQKIIEWVEELATTRVWKSDESNVLGLDGMDEDALFVLGRMLEGKSVDDTVKAIEARYSAGGAGTLRGELPEIRRKLRESLLFKGILADQE